MTDEFILQLARNALWMVLLIAGPILGLSLVTGLVISVFQATTQINEQTMTFVPKIIAVLAATLLFGPWMMRNMVEYTVELYSSLPGVIR